MRVFSVQATQLYPHILLSESEPRWLASQDVGDDGSGMAPTDCEVPRNRLIAVFFVRSAESDNVNTLFMCLKSCSLTDPSPSAAGSGVHQEGWCKARLW